MSTLILKFILCSAALYAVYHLVLRREKTLKFNRFFLLSILGCALLFPTVVTKTKYIEIPVMQTTFVEIGQSAPQSIAENNTPIAAEFSVSTGDLLWTLYGLVSLLLLIRLSHNLWQIQKLKRGGSLSEVKGLHICLREDILSSFTFLNTIYLNKSTYEKGEIPSEIIDHEAVHAKQRHSIDIITIEALQCVLWFNPVIYLIKSAIKMNHEYLADARVCAQTQEISQYQKTLIQYVYNSKQQPVLASQLTFGQTKNRLNMMVKNLQMRSAALRITLTLLVTAGALWGFGETKVIAQNLTQDQQEELAELKEAEERQEREEIKMPTIVEIPRTDQQVRFKNASGNWVQKAYGKLSKSEKEYFREPNSDAHVLYPPIPPKALPQQTFEALTNPKKYGVWIDGQRVENATVSNYRREDFHHFNKSKLLPNAKNYGQHEYQINLTTVESFENSAYSKERWVPYASRKSESKIEPKQNQDIPPPPPPRMIKINDQTQIKFQNANGDEVKGEFGKISARNKEVFMSSAGKGMILLPPPPPAHIDQEMLEKYANNDYKVWIDGKKISSEQLKNYNPNDFYLYKKQLWLSKDGSESKISGIEFVTRQAWTAAGKDQGTWIPFKKTYLPEESEENELPEEEEEKNKLELKTTNFNITFKSINNGIEMECKSGCNWIKLNFSVAIDVPQYINKSGVSQTLDLNDSEAGYLFSVTRTHNGIKLESFSGTAWKSLTYESKPFHPANLDFNGISRAD